MVPVQEDPATILVLNSGSSSVKFSLVDPRDGTRAFAGLAERVGSGATELSVSTPTPTRDVVRPGGHGQVIAEVFGRLREVALHERVVGVGHRVVHGGERFAEPRRIDAAVEHDIEAVASLAPLHNPANLLGIRAAKAAFPEIPQVAVFDTAFHQTIAPHAFRFAVPDDWYRYDGIRRYGFHGTSHHYVALEAARRLGRAPAELCLLTAHLGNGCSATAVEAGRSVDTTMGLTPLGGVVMGTRSGDLDPGVIGHVAQHRDWSVGEVVDRLNRESGLLGLSGLSNDMRTLLEARARGHAGAALAIDVFTHRLAGALLGLCASLPRVDALVFTGGIGERAPSIRAEVVARMTLLGAELDAEANESHGAGRNGVVSRTGPPFVMVVPTDEERMIAQQTLRCLNGESP